MQLSNDRLRVHLNHPGDGYRGSRFDWTGFITQVVLDGQHTFCTQESIDLSGTTCHGEGLCNEFGIFGTVAFSDAKPGEPFVKPGIGLLTRPDERDYIFYRPYEAAPFPVTVTSGADWVDFVSEPVDCRGLSLRLHKQIRLDGDRLQVRYHLRNTGTRPIAIDEYNHNFVAIDGHPIGPDYSLYLPFAPVMNPVSALLTPVGNSLRWNRHPTTFGHMTITGFADDAPAWWELRHEPSGVGLRESTDFPWKKLALFFTPRLASPEAFIDLAIPAGGERHWSRTWTFFAAETLADAERSLASAAR